MNYVAQRKYNLARGLTMLELLVVVAIVGILASIAMVSGRQILLRQEGSSTISEFKQIVSRGGSVAASRAKEIELRFQNREFTLREKVSGKVIQSFRVPTSVSINISDGTILEFVPSGMIKTLAPYPNPVVISSNDKTNYLQLSIIGQIKVTP